MRTTSEASIIGKWMKSYGLDVVSFSSGLNVGYNVGCRVLESKHRNHIESDQHVSRRDAPG